MCHLLRDNTLHIVQIVLYSLFTKVMHMYYYQIISAWQPFKQSQRYMMFVNFGYQRYSNDEWLAKVQG